MESVKEDYSQIIELLKQHKVLSLPDILKKLNSNREKKLFNQQGDRYIERLIESRDIYYFDKKYNKLNKIKKKFKLVYDRKWDNKTNFYYFLTPQAKRLHLELNNSITNISNEKLDSFVKSITESFRFLEMCTILLEKEMFKEKIIKKYLERKKIKPTEENIKKKICLLKNDIKEFYESLKPLRENTKVKIIWQELLFEASGKRFLLMPGIFQCLYFWRLFRLNLRRLFNIETPEEKRKFYLNVGDSLIVLEIPNAQMIKYVDNELYLKVEDILIPQKDLGTYFNIIYNNMSPNMVWISHKDRFFKKEVTDLMLGNIINLYRERAKTIQNKMKI